MRPWKRNEKERLVITTHDQSIRRSPSYGYAARRRPHSKVAFTLLETVVVMSIMGLLLSVLLPAIGSVADQMKAFKCTSNMRTVTLEFQYFADGTSDQGDSESLGRKRFMANDFQDSLYGLDEFWDRKNENRVLLSTNSELMMCPAGAKELTKTKGFPCGRQAIGPVEDVSVAMNMRLYRSVMTFKRRRVLAPARSSRVTESIMNHPYVPLVIDVDGRQAAQRNLDPFYIAPPLPNTSDPYSTGHHWMPSSRHDGKTNVAFVGGHVLSSEDPAREDWNWAYQAQVGK